MKDLQVLPDMTSAAVWQHVLGAEHDKREHISKELAILLTTEELHSMGPFCMVQDQERYLFYYLGDRTNPVAAIIGIIYQETPGLNFSWKAAFNVGG